MKKITFILLCIPLSSSATQYPQQYRRSSSPSPQMQDHYKIQQDFLRLQQNAGITTSDTIVKTVRRFKRSGKPLRQEQFNILRNDLNQLLSQTTLNITQIQQKIAQLHALRPGRWPFAQDYQALLTARTRGTTPVTTPTSPPTRMPTSAEQSERIQQDFKALKEQLGLSTTADQLTKVYPSPALPGSQQQLNLVRMELNRMLSKPALDDYDIVKIKQRIDELASLNPPRWPRAQDYQEILELRQ